MKKLIALDTNPELAKLIAECVMNNVRFQTGPTSYGCQDFFNGNMHVSSMKTLANALNNQLTKLGESDLFATDNANKSKKELLKLQIDTLVGVVKFVEARLKAELNAEKERAEKAIRMKNLKAHLVSKEFEAMAAKDARALREELEALEAELG